MPRVSYSDIILREAIFQTPTYCGPLSSKEPKPLLLAPKVCLTPLSCRRGSRVAREHRGSRVEYRGITEGAWEDHKGAEEEHGGAKSERWHEMGFSGGKSKAAAS